MTHIPTNRLFADAIATALDETFSNVQGMYLDRGTSLYETLATIDADEASRPVSPSCASIAAQVTHVTYYVDVLHEYIRGKKVADADWGAAWKTVVVSPAEWDTLQANLRAAHDRVRKQIAAITNWDQEHQVGGAVAIVAHTAYHLGEIRQALCTIKSTR